MDRLILEPVKVPWTISASEEINSFQASNDSVQLSLVADIINELSQLKKSWDEDTDVYDAVDTVVLSLTFDDVIYFNYIKPQQMIFGLDPQRYELHLDCKSEMDMFKKWFSNQYSPNPQMYQICNSDIKKQMNISDASMHHWILIGHDEIINVVAKSFRWDIVEYFNLNIED